MAINRRTVMALAGAMAGAGLLSTMTLPGNARSTSARYLGIRRHDSDGGFVAVVADAAGRIIYETPLPGRAHGIAYRASTGEAIAMARRPDRFAVVFDLSGENDPFEFSSPGNRHFQGHAVFDAEERLLFATENDFDRGRGVIGIYDATDGYRRIDEFPSYGIGAHELALMPAGNQLVVANGGILTHPDSGRAKLNIPTMAPSLAYIDCNTGRLLDQYSPGDERHKKLSIRHLDVLPDGRVVFACQDQLRASEILPLVAIHTQGDGQAAYLPAPESVYGGIAGYCGSVRRDKSGRVIAVSAPRGNKVMFWDSLTGSFLRTLAMPDGCGIAPGDAEGSFVLSSGLGVFEEFSPMSEAPARRGQSTSDPWDNHLLEAT